jgi:GNAT superfamily N-acetyltransferase
MVATDSERDGTELAVDTETSETILMHRSNSQLVQRAIDDLPVGYREALLLCEVEEMSYREIAEILSIPIGTVMSRLARARKAVRKSFLNTPSAALSRDLPRLIETRKKGRLIKLQTKNEAEIAILVSDQFQKQGLGIELLRRIVQIARDEKLSSVSAEMLRDKFTVQRIFKNVGFRVRLMAHSSSISAVLDL